MPRKVKRGNGGEAECSFQTTTRASRDARETISTTVPFKPRVPAPEPEPSNADSFVIDPLANPNLKQAVLLDNDAVLATRIARRKGPTVKMLFPISGENLTADPIVVRWESADSDGDALRYNIHLSYDNGATWDVVTVNWNQQSYALQQRYVKATTKGLIRVTASDGFNTASDVSDAPFNVPNHSPSLTIRSPSPNCFFTLPHWGATDRVRGRGL